MNGIDISNWQAGLDLSRVSADFVIIKASEGDFFHDQYMKGFMEAAQKSGKLTGLYHYASGNCSGEKEARWFVDTVYPYLTEAILVLDWEAKAVFRGTGYAKEFLDTVRKLTGIQPLIYMNKSTANAYDWSDVAAESLLWGAQYADYNPVHGYQETPWESAQGWGAWIRPAIFQYTSQGYLEGYADNLDLDKAYLTPDQWQQLAWGEAPEPEPGEKKTVEQLALEVLDGLWGNGDDRKKALTEAGYDYNAVQQKVNELWHQRQIRQMAEDVIAGKYGNGMVRVAKLGKWYKEVQAEVNRILGA